MHKHFGKRTQMKKLGLILYSLIIAWNATAQVTSNETIRVAKESLQAGNLAGAKKRIDMLKEYVSTGLVSQGEYTSLLKQWQDSIKTIYDKAYDLMSKKAYESAILEYQRLIDKEKPLTTSPIYGYIGYCYERKSSNLLAEKNYQLGIDHNEELAALCMARYIRKNNEKATSMDLIPLYEKASNYYDARDSLGVEYGRLGQIDKSYMWHRRSPRGFSKYKRAVYLLDKSAFAQLSKEYQTDDPIGLLTEAAEDGYAPAQYHLGLLYYYAKAGEKVQKNKEKGLELMKNASSQRYSPAIIMVRKIQQGY